MKTRTEDGMLVLADISGFTAFVTATELEHGPPIIAELLGEVMRRLAPPLEIQEVEGDAVFAVGPDRAIGPPAILVEALERAFAATTAASCASWWAAAARRPGPTSSWHTVS